MWKGFGVQNLSKTNTGVNAELGGRTSISQNKIDWNSTHEKKIIIEPSEKEVEMVGKALQIRIIKRMKELLYHYVVMMKIRVPDKCPTDNYGEMIEYIELKMKTSEDKLLVNEDTRDCEIVDVEKVK